MELQLMGKVIFFATGNIHKFNEARALLAEQGLATAMLRIKGVEIQSENLAEIAGTSALGAFKESRLPIIVEDAGLFVDALKGFPGPYAAYVYKTIGNAGLLKQMHNLLNRHAIFRSVIAYCDDDSGAVKCFEGDAAGKITHTQRRSGRSAFGFDPIFQPEGTEKTFAEMTLEEKNLFSHRAKALVKFAEWYKSMYSLER
jgi:XTP/dITP diphosphohydrolase